MPVSFRLPVLLALLLSSVLAGAAQSPAPSTASSRLPTLHADRVVLPFSVIKYFIFIEGEVNGVKGKFMFDTGSRAALTLNTHRVPLPGGVKTGRGFVGSGQSYDVFRFDTVRSIRLGGGLCYHNFDTVRSIRLGGGLCYHNAGPLRGNDQRFIEAITPDYLGLIGHDFFAGYLFKLDYQRQRLTFYRDTPARRASQDFLRGEQLVTALAFETRKLPNHPIIQVHLGDYALPATFDTGQLGDLYLADSLQRHLVARGLVIPAMADTASPRAAVTRLILPGGVVARLDEIGLYPPADAQAANQALGLTEPSTIDLGYSFLRQYKTLWDYPRHLLYLLHK